MDIVFNILLILHFLSLGLGVTTAVGMPIVMSRMAGATPEGKQMLGGIAERFGLNGRIALGLLVVTGVAMLWLRYGGVDGLSVWFTVKMVLVAVLVVASIVGAVVPRGRLNPRAMSLVTRLSLLGVVIAAVFAFN